MTRTELLAARANDVVEAARAGGVCLGEHECLIVREAVLFALLEVEREKEEALAHVREALRGMVEIFGHHDGYTVVRAARRAMQEEGS